MREFTITENAIKNLISTYADHKVQVEKTLEENDYDEELLYDDVDYQFNMGCCQTAEDWMRTIGISPESNFVQEVVDRERERCL